MTSPSTPEETMKKRCYVCGAPVIRTKGYDNGLSGAEKIASWDTYTYAPAPPTPTKPSTFEDLLEKLVSTHAAFVEAEPANRRAPLWTKAKDEYTAARSALTEAWKEMEAEREIESRRVEEWIDREAKLCPEDFGIEEYVAYLLSRISELEAKRK